MLAISSTGSATRSTAASPAGGGSSGRLTAISSTIAIVLIVGGIGASPYFRLDVALLGAVGYLLLAIHTFLSAKVLGEFRLSYMAGGPTELRLMLMAMTIVMPLVGGGNVLGTDFSAFDLFGLFVASILVTLFVVQSFTTAKLLAQRGG